MSDRIAELIKDLRERAANGCGRFCVMEGEWLEGTEAAAALSTAQERIRVMEELLTNALEYLKDLEDCGPMGETWQSDDLCDLGYKIADALNTTEKT